MTSTRAARAAGRKDAITATAISTNAETTTGHAPGILTSRKYLPARRASTNPNAAPATTPAAAIHAPSSITPLRSRLGSDPRASRMPNSRVRALDRKRQHAGDAHDGDRQRDGREDAKHQRVQSVRREHFCPNVFESGGVLDGLIGGHVAKDARDRWDQE